MGISSTICMYKILMEEDFKATIKSQRWLYPNMKDVVKKEVLKFLYTGIIYSISDSA